MYIVNEASFVEKISDKGTDKWNGIVPLLQMIKTKTGLLIVWPAHRMLTRRHYSLHIHLESDH